VELDHCRAYLFAYNIGLLRRNRRGGTGKRGKKLTTAVQTRGRRRAVPAKAIQPAGSPAQDLLQTVMTSLADSKAENPVTIDIRGKSALGDYMVVVSGRSHRHVGAIADQLVQRLKADAPVKPRIEGLPHCDWVLIDAGDIIVHVFRPEIREFYGLERMWQTPDAASMH
jgi:ribosome-associated protein